MFEEFISEELATILPSHYKLDKVKLEITLVNGVPATLKNFKELASIFPSYYYKMDLVDGKIVIMPVHAQTGQREANLIAKVTSWCRNNRNLVGLHGSSQTGYSLPLPIETVRSPSASVVLATRWNALTPNDQDEAFPPVAPNFVAEVRSASSTEDYCHEKMCMYMDAGVEEGILIDPINQTVKSYHGNNIVWKRTRPRTITSQILTGFILNLQGII